MTQNKHYLLGELIRQRKEKNNNYDVPVLGVSREGFISPKQEEADRRLYNTFYLEDFVFNPARMEVNSIAYNAFYKQAICSSLYEIFYVTRPDILLPEFLNMIVKRDEFARLCAFLGSGSAREYCRVEDISRIDLYLPDVKEQKKAVEAYTCLRKMKEENEALAAPLFQLCQSKIQELRHTTQMIELGHFIKRLDERNTSNIIKDVKGMSVTKEYREPTSKVNRNELANYKVVRYNQFGFIQTTNNEKCLVAVLSKFKDPIVISSVNEVFEISDTEKLHPDYLQIWFNRKEIDRYARFHSWGSARETFTFEDMKRFKVPVPSIDVQRAIADIFNCAQESKRIADEADKLSREICPALMQKVINS